MVPADENECRQMLTTGFLHHTPSVVRYPRGYGIGMTVESALTTLPIGKAQLRRQGQQIALLVFGTLLAETLIAAEQLKATVINMRFVKPLDVDTILQMAQQHQLLVTIEENVIMGGAGSAVNECLQAHACHTPVLNLGLPDRFLEHGKTANLLAQCGLDAQSMVMTITQYLQTAFGAKLG
jgi:1-deoxy-D-xylulose-5-phosphate synthase